MEFPMTNILSFLKHKEEQKTDDYSFVDKVKSFSSVKDITLAKAVEKLNAFQSINIEETIHMIATTVKNINTESAFKFDDDSILLNHSGRLIGLSKTESSLWIEGLYHKNDIEISHNQALNTLLDTIKTTQPEPEKVNEVSNKLKITI